MKELWSEFYEQAKSTGATDKQAEKWADNMMVEYQANIVDTAKNQRKERGHE